MILMFRYLDCKKITKADTVIYRHHEFMITIKGKNNMLIIKNNSKTYFNISNYKICAILFDKIQKHKFKYLNYLRLFFPKSLS